MTTLTPDQLAAWASDGFLCLRGALAPAEVHELSAWLEEVEGWAAAGGPGLHHHELVGDTAVLARSERLVEDHEGFRRFLTEGRLVEWAGALLGEAAVLYKEKVNYKRPGGAGFAPHQDAPAYPFVDHHVSAMVPLDPATVASGCLWVARGHWTERLVTDGDRGLDPAVAAGLDWEPVEVAPGDVLWFDSLLPHRSDTNGTDRPRRALYLTYNAAAEGDLRRRYYDDKAARLAAEPGGDRVRISIADDFLGVPVPEGR